MYYIDRIIDYLKSHPYIALAIGAVLLVLLWRETKLFLVLLLIVLVAGAVLYFVLSMSATGTSQKKGLIKKSTSPQQILHLEGLGGPGFY